MEDSLLYVYGGTFPPVNVTEYFCRTCKQLRLSCIADKSKCGNCGGTDLVHGDIGTLDKAKLLAES